MKFKIGFTIDAEALFGLMARMLPIEDLSVEELQPLKAAIRFDKRFDLPAKRAKVKRGRGSKADLTSGINRIILEALADGKPRTALSLGPVVKAMGFSASSTASRLNMLKSKGVVFQPEFGLWQIVAPQPKAAE